MKVRLLLAALVVALVAPAGAWAQAPKPAEPQKGSGRVKQVAEITDAPRGTVLARVHRGRKRLAVALVEPGTVPTARKVRDEPRS